MKKILLIDDEKDFCYFLRASLQLTGGYKIIIATDGSKGLRLAKWHKPDLILLDLMMPGVDGFQVLKKLKENKKTTDIAVIILTAKTDEQSKIEAAGLYCEDYIVKPIVIDLLRSKIENVLSAREGR